MSGRVPPALLPALALAGCSPAAETVMEQNTASVHLADADRDANAPVIAAFYKRTCLDAGDSSDALAGALQGSGWQSDQVQAASGDLPIAGWRLERGELVHSAMRLGAANNFIDCELILDAEVAPSVERMRDALRPLLRYPSLREISAGPPEARWQWPTGIRAERVLTVGAARPEPGRGPKLSLHLRITETALVAGPPPPPDLNELGIEGSNVQ